MLAQSICGRVGGLIAKFFLKKLEKKKACFNIFNELNYLKKIKLKIFNESFI